MSRKFNGANPYYSPEKCGLEILAEAEDRNMSYEFDKLVVWIDLESGNLYAARDSGCSCPSPFEGYTELGDMTLLRSLHTVESLMDSRLDLDERFQMRRRVQAYLGGVVDAKSAVDEFVAERDMEAAVCSHAPVFGPADEEYIDRIEALEVNLASARALNDQYLQVIREQGEFIQSIRQNVAEFTTRERGGRFT